jgi:hypothetical protein
MALTNAKTILKPRDQLDKSETWQLLKAPSIIQTALVVAQMTTAFDDVLFEETTVEFVDVSRFESIRVEFWSALGADDETAIVMLYGWHDTGPGHHIGTLGLTLGALTTAATTGWHANARVEQRVKDAFLPGTAYRGVDTITVTIDYELELAVDGAATPIEYQNFRALVSPRLITEAIPHANFNTYLIVDFSRSRYKWLTAVATAVPATASSTVGAVYRPIKYRTERGITVARSQ